LERFGPISQEVLAERRARFQAKLGEAVAIVPSAKRARRSHDVDFIFRQNSDLLYLTGFEQPEAIAVLTGDRFVLFVQPRDPGAETWTGRRPGVEGAVCEYGADEAHPVEEFASMLSSALENVTRLYHQFGDDRELDEIVLSALRQVRGKQRRGVTAPTEMVSPQSILHEMRLRKDEHELEILRAAADISCEAHRAAAQSCPAYPSIVGSGENATILHYSENRSRLTKGDLVLIDAGVELHGYASDVTRTYPVDGRFEGIRRDVYAVVLRAQKAAFGAIRPGTTLPAIHDVAVRSLVEGLGELGVLQGDPDTLIQEQKYKPFYMHQTGHFLGLDVHDVGNYNIEGKPRPLEPGMVFTVEPGLYFGAQEEAAPGALQRIGIRIEDDVVITDDGFEVLTAAIPREIDDVEAWMRD
jgi:Xaa-Pro aminopeptidase